MSKYSDAQIYSAMMKVADTLEKSPELYEFHSYEVGSEGCRACVWGHIGRQLGMGSHCDNIDVAQAVGFQKTMTLYRHLDELYGERPINSAQCAAEGLRSFAQRFKPREATLDDDDAFIDFMRRTIPEVV